MAVQGLDHFTIRTELLAQTADFFRRVVGLVEGARPAFRFPGSWMYAGGRPILHIVVADASDAQLQAYLGARSGGKGSGAVDHVSLRSEGLAEMQAHLQALGIRFRERMIPVIGEHQLFLEDPNGITVELIFPYSADDKVVGEAMPPMAMAD